jgi:hypothetical protein
MEPRQLMSGATPVAHATLGTKVVIGRFPEPDRDLNKDRYDRPYTAWITGPGIISSPAAVNVVGRSLEVSARLSQPGSYCVTVTVMENDKGEGYGSYGYGNSRDDFPTSKTYEKRVVIDFPSAAQIEHEAPLELMVKAKELEYKTMYFARQDQQKVFGFWIYVDVQNGEYLFDPWNENPPVDTYGRPKTIPEPDAQEEISLQHKGYYLVGEMHTHAPALEGGVPVFEYPSPPSRTEQNEDSSLGVPGFIVNTDPATTKVVLTSSGPEQRHTPIQPC